MKGWQHPLALVALAGAVALGGCGGGSSSTAKTSAAPVATTGTTPSSGASGTTGTTGTAATATGTSTGTSSVPAKLQKAVAECHRLIKNDKTLPSGARAKLETACEEAGKGDTAA